MTLPALQPLEPRHLRAFALADVLSPFDLTTGDFVPAIVESGLYGGEYPDGTPASLLYVAPGDTFALPTGLTVSLTQAVIDGTLILDHAAFVTDAMEFDTAATILPGAGQTVVTVTNPAFRAGATFRDVPISNTSIIYAGVDRGDANLDGNVNRDDLPYEDRLHLSTDDTVAALMGPPCPFATPPNPIVTHLELG